MFESFLKDPIVSEFILNYRKIDSNNKFCKGNIFGINLDKQKNIVSEKFYFTTSFILSKKQVLTFLPTYKDLYKYYKFLDLSDNPLCKRGVTFAVKKCSKGNITTQFHFKVPAIYYSSPKMLQCQATLLPKRIFDGTELYGISYEYVSNIGYPKTYVYFKNRQSKEYFRGILGQKIDCAVIEYTHSAFGEKIILINSKFKNDKMFPPVSKKLTYKNFGYYLNKSEYSAYIYPKAYKQLENQGEVDTLSFLK
jgi:CDP-glycerol glycerophosphotransferase (TagB/SpsB family)